MSSIPSNISRAPTLLTTLSSLNNIQATNLELLRVTEQLSTQRSILRPSDDSIKAAAITLLDDRIAKSEQRIRNLNVADSRLTSLDTTLAEASDLVIQAKSIASTQVNLGTTGSERDANAQVINSMLDGLYDLLTRDVAGEYLFGGSKTGSSPFNTLGTGYVYTGEYDRLFTDTGIGRSIPVSVAGASAIGTGQARYNGTALLEPDLTPDTRLSDIDGARGLGVSLGAIQFQFDGGAAGQVDLSGADTVEDVVTAIESSIRQYETNQGVTVLGAGGVSISGRSISIDVAADPPNPDPELVFSDLNNASIAADLGLVSTSGPSIAFSAGAPTTVDLNPRLTLRTPVSALGTLGTDLGEIQIDNAGLSAIVDLSGATSVQEIRNRIEAAGLGVRVDINANGDGIDIINDVSANPAQSLSISEVAGGSNTAEALGIRTLTTATPVSQFNDGKGVEIVTNRTHPTTGLIDRDLNIDFTITLGDGRNFGVDLRPQDITTLGTILDRINEEAVTAGIAVPGDFIATAGTGTNGIQLTQATALGGTVSVARNNNSPAWEQLGLKDGQYDTASATFAGTDRARVVSDTVFTRLISLRDALLANDDSGITLAGERLEGAVDAVAETRGLIGGLAARVEAASNREQDLSLLDENVRSTLRDVDYADAATRLSLLQTQLQAGYQSTSAVSGLSLLDFLG